MATKHYEHAGVEFSVVKYREFKAVIPELNCIIHKCESWENAYKSAIDMIDGIFYIYRKKEEHELSRYKI